MELSSNELFFHLSSFALLILIAAIAVRQVSQKTHTPAWLLLLTFIGVSAAAMSSLYSLSPLWAVELGAIATLTVANPVNGLCFFITLLLFRPWEMVDLASTFLNAIPRGFGLLCLTSWLVHGLAQPKTRIGFHLPFALGLAFGAWSFLSTVFSGAAGQAQSIWFGNYSKSLIVFVLCYGLLQTEEARVRLKLTLGWTVFTLAAHGVIEYLKIAAQVGFDHRLRSIGLLEDPNDFASITVLTLPLVLAPILVGQARIRNIIVAFCFTMIAMSAVWYSRSRGALVSILALPFIRALWARHARIWLTAAAPVAALGVYFMTVGALNRTAEDLSVSSDARINYWKTAVVMTVKNPVFGVGFDQFPKSYESYAPTLQYEWGERTAHSSWFLAFAENGIVGGLLFVGLFLSVFKIAWRQKLIHPDHLYSLVAYGFAMSFLSHTYLIYPYILFGMIAASGRADERHAFSMDLSQKSARAA